MNIIKKIFALIVVGVFGVFIGYELVGPIAAKSALDWFQSERGRSTIGRMKELGLDPESGKASGNGSPFFGKTIVLTGTMEKMSRNQAQDKIRALGGNVSSSVSRKTDFVIAGPGAGSKLDDAKKYGVRVVSESEFLAMVG